MTRWVFAILIGLLAWFIAGIHDFGCRHGFTKGWVYRKWQQPLKVHILLDYKMLRALNIAKIKDNQ